MSNSYWLYLHPELQGKQHYWKVGKALTPYSAVRARQRFLVDDFYLTAVWFGHPKDVATIEQLIHSMYRPMNEARLGSSRSELVYYNPEDHELTLESSIQLAIDLRGASLKRMSTGNPNGYHATNSTQCPFDCPQEKYAHDWSRKRIYTMFNRRIRTTWAEHLNY